jgi:hypothetical protein
LIKHQSFRICRLTAGNHYRLSFQSFNVFILADDLTVDIAEWLFPCTTGQSADKTQNRSRKGGTHKK